MRRLARILVNVAAAVSLVLALGFAGLWTRSLTWWDEAGYFRGHSSVTIVSVEGSLRVAILLDATHDSPPRFERLSERITDPRSVAGSETTAIARLGFFFTDHRLSSTPSGRPGMRVIGAKAPFGFLVTLALILPSAWLIRRTRAWRQSPDRCPECGHVPAHSS